MAQHHHHRLGHRRCLVRLDSPRSYKRFASTAEDSTTCSPSILFYKHDLRIDDHPGLHYAVENASSIIPVVCFDPSRYHTIIQSKAAADAFSKAIASLDNALQQRYGSSLIVLNGKWEEQIPQLVQEVGASSIITEHEVETHWRVGIENIEAALPSTVNFYKWRAPIFEKYTDDYKEWKKNRPKALPPQAPPSSLPPLPHHIKSSLSLSPATTTTLPLDPHILYQQAQHAYLETLDTQFKNDLLKNNIFFVDDIQTEESTSIPSSYTSDSSIDTSITAHDKISSRSWHHELATKLSAGEGPVMDALKAYLNAPHRVETDGERDSVQLIQEMVAEAIAKYDVPSSPGGCFPALFNQSISLGVISRRRVYERAISSWEAIDDNTYIGNNSNSNSNSNSNRSKGSTGSRLFRLDIILKHIGWLLTSSGGAGPQRRRRQKSASAAIAAAEAADFHEAMAKTREGTEAHGAVIKHWRWRGVLTDYLEASPLTHHQGVEGQRAETKDRDTKRRLPSICLVHGFGAFSEHWRSNVAALAAQGFRVYAVTLPGYGRAEKPSMSYGQDLWRDFLADFVVNVIRSPVVVAGNSIGGFISASLAADYPEMVDGLVLVNSAGQLQEGYVPPSTPPSTPMPPTFVVNGISSALFSFLEGDISKQLKRMYPTVPERADEWLVREIARAAGDPGALGVFRSVFYLPKPRALNYLVSEKFKKPTLVLQGSKDPLNDAVGRAKEIDRLCENARIVLLDAGHTCHDEVPEMVNKELVKFLEEDVLNI